MPAILLCMARKWTKNEEIEKRRELTQLYVRENKSIGDIAKALGLSESTVYDRLVRLRIPVSRSRKLYYNNKRNDIVLPRQHSKDLAEFVGILLGDGHISPTQVMVTLGKKDEYAEYVAEVMEKLFRVRPKILVLRTGDKVVYIGSTTLVRWFLAMGLTANKVAAQVDVPNWIFADKEYVKRVVRGLFDTDGSVYKLKFGIQISFSNRSQPLLCSFRKMLVLLDYQPSRISGPRVYLTRIPDIKRFFEEIKPKNTKHIKRFKNFMHAPVG